MAFKAKTQRKEEQEEREERCRECEGAAAREGERERETNVEKYTTSAINAAAVAFFSPLLYFFPLALPRCVVALAQPSPPCAEPLFNKFNYLPFDGSGNPSNVHEICGVGLPAAEHFKLTAGPGCSVCSMKL